MSNIRKGDNTASTLSGFALGAIGLVSGLPAFFAEQTSVFPPSEVQSLRLILHSTIAMIYTNQSTDLIKVSIRGKRVDVKNTKVILNDGMLSVSGVANLARSIEVIVSIPANTSLNYTIDIFSGSVNVRDLKSNRCMITANSCDVNINNSIIDALEINNDNGTVGICKLIGREHYVKSNFGILTITDSAGKNLIVEAQFGKATVKHSDYEAISPISDSGGIVDIQ